MSFPPVVDCDSLPNPTNGSVIFSMSTFGAMATYMCDEGFDLIGNSTRLCLANGSWEGTAPTCQSELNGLLEINMPNAALVSADI